MAAHFIGTIMWNYWVTKFILTMVAFAMFYDRYDKGSAWMYFWGVILVLHIWFTIDEIFNITKTKDKSLTGNQVQVSSGEQENK